MAKTIKCARCGVGILEGGVCPTCDSYKVNPVVQQNLINSLAPRFRAVKDTIWPPQRHIYMNIAKRVSGRVVDIGCGLGIGTNILEAVGFDISDEHIAFAQSLYPSMEFRFWDIVDGRVGYFDVVVCLEVIEHVAPSNLSRVMINLQNSGERLFISTPNRLSPDISDRGPTNANHTKEYTPDEILQHLPQAMIRDPITWETLPKSTIVTPLVYEVSNGLHFHSFN